MRLVRMLAFHADYVCRHAGACCSSGWPIAVEADAARTLDAAARAGRLAFAHERTVLIRPPGAPAATPALLPMVNGTCAFRRTGPDAHCTVHRALGHHVLPLACRQFPRVTVHDPRGVSVTLSHYCPTAAATLGDGAEDADPLIVVNPPRFPAGAEYVGLDATDALPPLIRRDLLMDWESWWRTEELAVAALLRGGTSAGEAVAMVRSAVRQLERWRPGTGVLLQDEVERAFACGESLPPLAQADALVDEALARVPALHQSRARAAFNDVTSEAVARRFLAAHAFANWRVHEKDGGLGAWLRSIETAHAFLSAGAGVRHADLVLRHLVGD